jgi:hypothetical protein
VTADEGKDETCHLFCESASVVKITALHDDTGGKMSPRDKAEVLVNDVRLLGTMKLQHGDCLRIGTSALLQINIPSLKIAGEAQSGYAKQLSERIGSERAELVYTALCELQPSIDEGNLITQELTANAYVFRPQVLTDVARMDQDPEWMVSLCRAEGIEACGAPLATWSAGHYLQRLDAMRAARDEVRKRGVPWGQTGDLHLWAHADVILEVDTPSGDVAGIGTSSEALPRAVPPLGPGARSELVAEVAEAKRWRSEAMRWRSEAERVELVPIELRDARFEVESAMLELAAWQSRAELEARKRAELAAELRALDAPRFTAECAAEEEAQAEAREGVCDSELGRLPYNKTYISVTGQLRARLNVVQSASKIVDVRVTDDLQLEKSVHGCLRRHRCVR